MGTAICMNASCGVSTYNDGTRGWPLRSGGFALLCHKCGSAYESLIFCDTFHLEETGWRDCSLCGRHIHCGCIASKSLFECLDYGGVGCITCMKGSQFHLIQRGEIPNGFGTLMTMQNVGDFQSTSVENSVNSDIGDENLLQLCKIVEANGNSLLSPSQRVDISASLGQSFREKFMSTFGEAGTRSSNVMQSSLSSPYENPDNSKFFMEVENIEESLAQPSSSMNFGAPSALHNLVLPFSCGTVEAREQGKVPYPFQQSQRSRPLFPKPLKNSVTPTNSEANKTMIRHMRIARPPAEGRGKNQLLPRYWPRITDQELEQLSGDLNSTIVPLFEKVLSASDAGRIGRLVLPKACAEAYFPPISQSEGLPIRIQDVKGNEWTFQFRFWPNNNSRMYVLEGVTPCIQSMQLRAGDTVIFSRIDPEGKLVMGFRKATNSIDLQRSYTQDDQTPVIANGCHFGEPSCSSIMDNLQTEDGDLHKLENHGDSTIDNQLQQQIPVVEKKRARNIGPKNKRLLMHSEDALELRLTWEEAQDLLRPPPRAKPSIVTIEDHDFEEYDEPPIFGKRTIFTASSSKSQEQWAQCGDCSKWRRFPVDALLSSDWTCFDNIWDSNRCSCSEPEEINPKELHNLLRAKKDHTKRRTMEKQEPCHEVEPSGLDALASAAVLGDYVGDLVEPAVGATTKHPRHRSGCTCIVCIQPPSGKGKHKTTCTCIVCLTVKRRFKTQMLRKKKRQAELKSDKEVDVDGGACRDAAMRTNESANQESQSRMEGDVGENSNGKIDLNCDPDREGVQEEMRGSSLVQTDCLPSDRIERHNAVSGLIGEEDVIVPSSSGRSERGIPPAAASLTPLDSTLHDTSTPI